MPKPASRRGSPSRWCASPRQPRSPRRASWAAATTIAADHAATEAMRRTMDELEMQGTIVIGEGERDEAPMLYIGEQVGTAPGGPARDRHRGRSAGGHQPGARTARPTPSPCWRRRDAAACCTRPTRTSRSCASDPSRAGHVDITRQSPPRTWQPIAAALRRARRRHHRSSSWSAPGMTTLIEEVRGGRRAHQAHHRRRPLGRHRCAVSGTGVHAVMGIGGAPEGVSRRPRCAAWAARCRRASASATTRSGRAPPGWAHTDESRILHTSDLAPGSDLVFGATGVTDGDLLHGVRFFGGGARTHSLVMGYQTEAGPLRGHGPHVRPRAAPGRPPVGRPARVRRRRRPPTRGRRGASARP